MITLDFSTYRSDKLVTVDSSCTFESVESMVQVADDCNVDILLLCNGIINCPQCADEIESNCYGVVCEGGEDILQQIFLFKVVTISVIL